MSSTSAARRLRAALTCAALLLASGCDGDLMAVRILIRGFEESAVEGFGIWRESAQGGQWEFVGEIAFERSITSNGIEVLDYEVQIPGSGPLPVSSEIVRYAAFPDYVTLEIWFRSPWFRPLPHQRLQPGRPLSTVGERDRVLAAAGTQLSQLSRWPG